MCSELLFLSTTQLPCDCHQEGPMNGVMCSASGSYTIGCALLQKDKPRAKISLANVMLPIYAFATQPLGKLSTLI